MDWGPFLGSVVGLLVLFLVTGYPVTPHFANKAGNYYAQRNSAYFALLSVHYWLGAFFLTFLIVGLLRTVIWADNAKQVANVMAWAMFITGGFMLFGTYKMMPEATEHAHV
mmetsp:Transcript_9674/g.18431  ORF Transcript_9674/g.18431 Transcript_9674/m.18431 type:complete len:111 (+) Transcript_9674:132-464(+)